MAKLMSLSSLPGPQQGQVKKEKVSSLIPVLARHLAKADQPQQQSSVSSLKLFSQVSEVRSHCYGLLEEDNEELMTFVYDQCGKMDNLTEAASASNTNKAWASVEEDLIMALARDSSDWSMERTTGRMSIKAAFVLLGPPAAATASSAS